MMPVRSYAISVGRYPIIIVQQAIAQFRKSPQANDFRLFLPGLLGCAEICYAAKFEQDD